jgi:hypothetical protein
VPATVPRSAGRKGRRSVSEQLAVLVQEHRR